MKSTVVIDVDAPAKEVAKLFADPKENIKWMTDIDRFEPMSGKPGMPGSVYRLISKSGVTLFTATVVRRLPNQLQLNLDGDNVTVEVEGTLKTLPDGRTRIVSKEDFKFKGVWNKAYGLLTQPTIRKAHRRQIQAFKKFVEQQHPPSRDAQSPPHKSPYKKTTKKRYPQK